jgi:hypothetical protein
MIKFENTEVMNFEGAIRGMRNPLNSWDKSDSYIAYYQTAKIIEGDIVCCPEYLIGENDLALMKKLIKAGSDHRKFMRQLIVSVDITAPLYWWKEFDTYKVGTVANSCSTMHKIHAKEFTLEDFSYEHLDDNSLGVLAYIIANLNECRNIYINGEKCGFYEIKPKCKDYWWQMIQLLPSSYNQKRTVTLNYETLYNIYGSRKNHKLDEWSVGFIKWIESLPYASELITDR